MEKKLYLMILFLIGGKVNSSQIFSCSYKNNFLNKEIFFIVLEVDQIEVKKKEVFIIDLKSLFYFLKLKNNKVKKGYKNITRNLNYSNIDIIDFLRENVDSVCLKSNFRYFSFKRKISEKDSILNYYKNSESLQNKNKRKFEGKLNYKRSHRNFCDSENELRNFKISYAIYKFKFSLTFHNSSENNNNNNNEFTNESLNLNFETFETENQNKLNKNEINKEKDFITNSQHFEENNETLNFLNNDRKLKDIENIYFKNFRLRSKGYIESVNDDLKFDVKNISCIFINEKETLKSFLDELKIINNENQKYKTKKSEMEEKEEDKMGFFDFVDRKLSFPIFIIMVISIVLLSIFEYLEYNRNIK